MNLWYSQLHDKAVAEAEIIVSEFADHGIEIGGVGDCADTDPGVTPNGIGFMYAQGHILTRAQYLGGAGGIKGVQPTLEASRQRGVLDVLHENGVETVDVTRVVRDVVLLRFNPKPWKSTSKSNQASSESDSTASGDRNGNGELAERVNQIRASEPPDVLRILDLIDNEFGEGIATPDQVLTAANGPMTPCSATEPEEVSRWAGPDPAICRDGGTRVRIFVADTGLIPDAATTFPWLHGIPDGTDLRTGTGNTIVPYEGHGTFVTGVLRCLAPQAQIYVANIFNIAGSALESDFVRGLNAAFGFGFEILHLTASCMTRNNHQLIALGTWLEQLRPYKGVICVAPAGNNDTRRPSWPGAFRDVLCVGALATDRRSRAGFSDHGGWVDVYAPGQNLINAFGSGTYACQIPPDAGDRTFTGLAQWSGTSFSAPIVTGLIAARMARCGESAREAAAALLAEARTQAIQGVGPALFPRCDGGCGRDGDGGRCGCCGRCGVPRPDCGPLPSTR